jgi:hypothetical protein
MSEIMEKSSQIGQKLPKSPLGRGSSSWGEEEEEWGGARAGEKGDIAVGHLYRATTRVGTNVLTFVWGGCSDRYKCAGLICTGRSQHPVQMWGICVGWVASGPHEPLWEDIYTGGKNTQYKWKIKPWTNLPFFSSAHLKSIVCYMYMNLFARVDNFKRPVTWCLLGPWSNIIKSDGAPVWTRSRCYRLLRCNWFKNRHLHWSNNSSKYMNG